MNENRSIEDVKQFWDASPLFSGEAQDREFTKEYFSEHESVIINDGFVGSIPDYFFQGAQGGKVLDVGCGTGFWVRQFCRRGVDTYGVDISSRAVDIARKSLSLFDLDAVVMAGNAEDLPFENETFDHINCQGVIHHTPDTEKCISEFYRVLKPGGTVCFSVYYKNIILRQRWLFRLVQSISKILNVGLKGRGRESLVGASASPEELVRQYDGRDNPIGKAYTKKEIVQMASKWFHVDEIRRWYFPARAISLRIPKSIHRYFSVHYGLMIVLRGVKL